MSTPLLLPHNNACNALTIPEGKLVLRTSIVPAALLEYLCKLLLSGKLILLFCGCIHAVAPALSFTQPETTLFSAGTRKVKLQFGIMPRFMTEQCTT